MERSILHVNVVNFYVAVARALDPKLQSYPLAVATAGAARRMVLDVSGEGREAGVCRGMTLEVARRACPDLKIVNPIPAQYDRAGTALFEQASQLSPLVEPAGPGHLFIDLTGTGRLLGPAVDIADSVRKTVRQSCRFDCTVGVAINRLVSKIATRVIMPRGLCRVITGCEEDFMAPLPVNLLPGVEERILVQLQQFNLKMIRDIHRIPALSLARALGPIAYEISEHAHGIDETPVRQSIKAAPTILESVLLPQQTNNEQEIACTLFHLVSIAGARVRKQNLAAAKIRLAITYADGIRASRSVRLRAPLQGDLSLFDQCAALLRQVFTRRVRLTELGIELSDLTFPYGQIDLFQDTERESHLMSAIDTIRDQFGDCAIGFWGREKVA